ncbi:MAG: hypothetical protein QM831_25255 [Kofleriaceae bacterium]
MSELGEINRRLALIAGEAFCRTVLEPDGYTQIELARVPFASFDFVYERDGDVVVVDTVVGDQELDGLNEFAAGSTGYVELIVDAMRANAADVAGRIGGAFAAGRLRYYEVRQLFDDNDELGETEAREFAL